MKKILLMSVLVSMAFVLQSYAQNTTLSGKVTSAEDGSTLPGVNVILKGTSIGTTTGVDGTWKLSVPGTEGTLLFSFIGFATQEVEISGRSTINVKMESDVTQLGEVVVTALGVARDKKTLGYSTQEVKAEDLRVARETNINSAIAGKVAGVQVVSGSGAKFGAAAIKIRGIRGLNGSSPLYVLDGIVINDPASINMDNVASINVLKGANAAALYGNRARDGVVMITSKEAKKGSLDISLNTTTTFEKVAVLPEYQNEYGGGYSQTFDTFEFDPAIHDAALSGLDGAPIAQFYADESWGPRLDGRQVAQWDAFTPGLPGYGQTRPWSPQPDNVRDFFETGVFVNNSLSVSKADDNYSVSVTLTNSQRTGVMPGTDQDRTFLNLNSKINLSERLKLKGIANYSKTNTNGNFFEGYNSIGSNVNQWFQRQLDVDLLRQFYRLPDGTYTSWNINSPTNLTPLYWDNPYTSLLSNTGNQQKEVFQGKFGLDYELIDGLVVGASLNRNTDTRWADAIAASGTLGVDGYSTNTWTLREDNIEFKAKYDKQINDNFSLSALVGGNIRNYNFSSWNLGTVGGLSVPELYNIGASIDRPSTGNTKARKSIRSVFAQASIGYKETFFIDATFRTDWDSSLPNGRNDFVYPSVSTSFVFSELLNNQDILSFGKIRASYAEVGQEITNPWATQLTYGLGTPYGSNATMSVPNSQIAPDLTAATTSAIEVGFELSFLKDRIRTDFSWYNYDNTGELINVSTPATSGFTGLLLNAGKGYTRGWDAAIGATILETSDLKWDVNLNFAKSTNFIEELYPGLDAIVLANGWRGTSTVGGWGGISAKAIAGEEWGTIIGRKFRRNDAGQIIVGANGRPLFDTDQELGSILPDYTGGFFNRFTYKNFDLSFTIDFQVGGKFHSITRMFTAYSGLSSETVGLNDKGNNMRDPVADGGGLKFDGVFEDGTPNNVYLEVDAYWKSLFPLHENWLYDATFVKLREIRFGYQLPESLLNNISFIKGASVAIVANNPWLIHAKVDGIDPSEISGDTVNARNNGAWVESGNLPGTRSIGFDIMLKL
ncbi:SusC/RagA family TonB-linked outer membrane protein [Fulvivirgaceae bacterium BMA10]|uniref:SusC/RagA family TonB-linked outer membrane protein n=1 Tax=Splendidivirga corallicola TaxID=3051826 RepID=A0ABT8KVD9_9BACT|nr:SusC/RagA family TonB-linked outer membrane protein [Fulvivirgaceae bacterium BMA10]